MASLRNGSIRILGVLPALAAAVVASACGGASSSPAASAPPTPTPATPTGPPTAQITAIGTEGLGGALAVGSVNCSQPSLDGPTILMFATPQAAGVSVRITLQAGKVTVVADAGAGAQFTARSFSGPGVSGFNAARGAQIQTTLTEMASGSPRGSIGAMSSVSGKVACNDQQPGTSTVTLTGNTTTGAMKGGISPVHVQCEANGGALTIGLTKAGTTTELVDMFGGAGTVSLYLLPRGAAQGQQFAASGPGVTTVTSTAVHFNADVVESAPGSAAHHTIHISGDVTCGSSVAT